jgi:site-specific recombinase XerD
MMVGDSHWVADGLEQEVVSSDVHRWFPGSPLIQDTDVHALITDLFGWLETEWQLPLASSEQAQPVLPHPLDLKKDAYTAGELQRLYGISNVGRTLRKHHILASASTFNRGRRSALYRREDLAPVLNHPTVFLECPPLLREEVYTVEEIIRLYRVKNPRYFYKLLRKYRLVPVGYRSSKGKPLALYKKADLASAIAQWEWDRLAETLNSWWLRFAPPACQNCGKCLQHASNPLIQRLACKTSLHALRSVVASFLREVIHLGSVSAWWQAHQAGTWEGGRYSAAWGILFMYLLDRRFIHLSIDELLRNKPLCNLDNEERTRLWRRRCPEEYAQFLRAVEATNYHQGTEEYLLIIFSLLVLLRYGLVGLAELERPLTTLELQQMCGSRCLVTPHLSHGLFLPHPLSKDIRVGHVILDEIRSFFWQYACRHQQEGGRLDWGEGPHHWKLYMVNAIEQALGAPMYRGKKGILSRRPETEQPLVSPWRLDQEGVETGTGYVLLPSAVQTHLRTYMTHCYQEQGRSLSTLRSRATALMHFFIWARGNGKLVDYPQWNHAWTPQVFRTYLSTKCAEMTVRYRMGQALLLTSFFATLDTLGEAVPSGYSRLSGQVKVQSQKRREVPHEEILDRVFHEGVRQLSYDPLARLALTIQYYCGTRVTETCDLHLFCVLEDQQGHAYLLIPRGKTKKERPFPIVEVGMGPLLEYMEQVVGLRLSSEGTSRTLGRTNFRYVQDDPERGRDWQYLFDRVPIAEGRRKKRRGRLSGNRVNEALHEALLLAAKHDSEGLFVAGTSQLSCQHRRKKGQECRYFAVHDGITTCPRCGSHLSGHRGSYCHHILEEDFVCDGVTLPGEVFCPKCDAPLATLVPISTHVFRHNSVSRASRAGVSVSQNMRLHGHETIPMHLHYVHFQADDMVREVREMFVDKRLQEVSQAQGPTAGKVVEEGKVCTVSLDQYLAVTLRRTLKRRTCGIWGGFWAGALAQRGVGSPLSVEEDIVILEESYEHAVAQYWYEALGLAVSEVAFERATHGSWKAQVPAFLDRQKIEDLVQLHQGVVQDSLGTLVGRRLMETDIEEQRQFLQDLAEKLRPWWQHLGTIDPLVELFAPGGGYAFQKRIATPTTLSGEADSLS